MEALGNAILGLPERLGILGLPERFGVGKIKYDKNVYYADQDGDNGTPTKFLPEEHRKYDAKCYFSKAGRRDGEHRAEAMHDAQRGPDSMKAYSEFLRGLELINQQEYISKQHTGELANSFEDKLLDGIPKKERQKKLKGLARWERTIRQRHQAQTTATFVKNLERRVQMGVDTAVEKTKKGHLPIRGWTRDILLRPPEADFSFFAVLMGAVSQVIFISNLVTQLRLFPIVCSAAFACPRAGTCGLPAVAPPVAFRAASTVAMTEHLTFVSLTKPWNPYVETSCMYGDANCKDPGYLVQWPYLQKSDGSVGIATGVASQCTFRNDSNKGPDGITHKDIWLVWDPFTESLREEYYECPDELLAFEETWNTSAGAGLNVSNTSEAAGWGFNVSNTSEAVGWGLNVSNISGAVGSGVNGSNTSEAVGSGFNGSNTSEAVASGLNVSVISKAAFHFDSSYYKKIHEATIKCLNLVIEDDDADLNLTQASDFRTMNGSTAAIALAMVRDCMVKERTEYSPLTKCDCGLFKWSAFPVQTYYSGPEVTKTCFDGFYHGRLCSDATKDVCAGSGSFLEAGFTNGNGTGCQQTYKDQRPLNTSSAFGCFFTAPDAAAQMSPEYSTCGESLWASWTGKSGVDHRKLSGGLQKGVNMAFSKRTILVFVFLLKEGGWISASVMMIFISVVILVASIPLCMILSILYLAHWTKLFPFEKLTLIQWGILVKENILDFARDQLKVTYAMFRSLSSTRQIYMFGKSIRNGLVNPSIKDMEAKLPVVANLLYNLTLLITLVEYSSCVSPGEEGNTLMITLILSLAQLLYQMNAEHTKLKRIQKPLMDLNENRLTKFEVALLMTKIMEDFLDADIQYNFVEHFRSSDSLLPKVDSEDATENQEAFGESDGADRIVSPACYDTYSAFKNRLMKAINDDIDVHNTIFYMPPLPPDLAKEFGHDGLGLYSGEYGKFPEGLEQVVKSEKGGQVKLLVSEEHLMKLAQGSIALSRSQSLLGAAGKVKSSVWEKNLFDGCSTQDEGSMAVASNQVMARRFTSDDLGGDYADPRDVIGNVTGAMPPMLPAGAQLHTTIPMDETSHDHGDDYESPRAVLGTYTGTV